MGQIRDKLIEKKQEWARDGRLLTGTTADPARDRLPPGQRLVRDWPVLDLGAEPDVTPEKFRLDIDGAVENRLSLRLDEFMALPQTDSVSDIHCVTQWSRYDNHWRGVAARDIVEAVRPNPEVRHVVFTSFDGYTTNLRLDQFDQSDVFVIHQWEGKPLTAPTVARCECWCRDCISGNPRNGYAGFNSPSATIRGSGKRGGITITAIRGPRNGTRNYSRRATISDTTA